jgi:broad specificity phosphatase PhoE
LARIILVRHGQTGWNKQEKFRGWVDIDLDDTGRRQAKAAASRVSQWNVTSIYSSPLKRALTTARALADIAGLEVVPADGITDMNFGVWQGMSIADVEKRYPEQFDQWCHRPERLEIPDGETLEGVRKRAVATIEELAAKHEGETIAVVTHRVVCRVLLCHLLGLDNSHFWQIEQDTTAINIFDMEESRITVHLINDTCHLRTG